MQRGGLGELDRGKEHELRLRDGGSGSGKGLETKAWARG